jgi:Protein of unknown function (DUF3303)
MHQSGRGRAVDAGWHGLPLPGTFSTPAAAPRMMRGRQAAQTTIVPRTKTIGRMPMKYVISWFERPQGSPIEYENAQKRILEVFGQWKAPANFKIDFFVIRVGEWGGHMLVECDDPVTIHKFCSMLPAFVFEARPVITVEEAVRGELEVIAWRDGLTRK